MKRIITVALLLISTISFGQTQYKLAYDTIYFNKTTGSGNSEFILRNSTRATQGFLKNIGNGRTQFVLINSSSVDTTSLRTVANSLSKAQIQTALNAKQGAITLTTTGTSGASTLTGSTLNIPNYAGGGGGGITSVTSIGTTENPSITGSTLNIPNMFGGVWAPYGTIMVPDLVADQDNLEEPTVIYEGNPQILTNASGNVFKMWYTSGATSSNIQYAESMDGLSWIRSSAICVANHARSHVLKVGITYYMYAVSLSSSYKSLDRYTSTNGLTWTLANSGVITSGAGGAWNGNSLANLSVNYDGSTWHMLLSGNSGGTSAFTTGYYSSSDGITWAQYGSNPVIGSESLLMAPGSTMKKIGSTWYIWTFGGGGSPTLLPTDIYRYSSANLTTWTQNPTGATYVRTQADEGVGMANGQVANPCLVEANGKTYMFYSAVGDGSGVAPGIHLKVAIANYTLANLVATNEGSGNAVNVAQIAGYTKIYQDLNFIKNAVNTYSYQPATVYISSPTASGDGYRVRDATTTTSYSQLGPSILYLNKVGVSNTVSGTTTALELSGWGGINFKNGSGSGISTLGSASSAGGWSFPSVSLSSDLNIQPASFAATTYYGITMKNQGSSSVGIPVRHSPAIYQNGTSWNTTSNSSKIHEFVGLMRPTSGATTGFNYVWGGSVNDNYGTFTDLMTLSSDGNLKAKSVQGIAVTFANLPTTPVEGMMVPVTNSTTAVWGDVITGGGAIHVLAYYNGIAWTVMAK